MIGSGHEVEGSKITALTSLILAANQILQKLTVFKQVLRIVLLVLHVLCCFAVSTVYCATELHCATMLLCMLLVRGFVFLVYIVSWVLCSM